jgi:hypothetical protein
MAGADLLFFSTGISAPSCADALSARIARRVLVRWRWRPEVSTLVATSRSIVAVPSRPLSGRQRHLLGSLSLSDKSYRPADPGRKVLKRAGGLPAWALHRRVGRRA